MEIKEKKIGRNYLYNVSFQLFSLLTPLVVTPYISRVLGAESIGIYGYTLSISTYFIVIGNLGFPLYGQREIAYVAEDKKLRSIKFFEILYGKIIGLLIVVVLFAMLLLVCEKEIKGVLLLQGIGIIADVINIGWYYQGIEEFKLTVIRNYFIKIFSIVCIFLLVKDSSDLYMYTLIINIANLIGNFLICVDLKRYVDFSCYKRPLRSVVIHFKSAIWLGIPYYISSVYSLMDKTMLGILNNNYSEVGYYEQSQKIINCATSIVTALGTVYMPRLANELAQKNNKAVLRHLNQGTEIIYVLSLPIMTGLFVLADMIVPWFYGQGYEKVEGLLKIFSITICVLGISNFIGNQYLVVRKKEKQLIYSIVIGVVVNLCLDIMFIPQYASYGAAVATLVAMIIKTLIQLYVVRDELKVRKIIFMGLKYLAASLIMGGVILYFRERYFYEKTFFNTIILAVIGVLIYFIEIFVIRKRGIIRSLNNSAI